MNTLKKSLFIALTLFLTIESSTGQTRTLKPKLRRPQKANVATILKADDQAKVEKAVAAINAQTQTAQEKVEIKKALQTEIIKETQEIKQELAKAQNEHSQYINYGQALEIIKSKKELSKMRGSSWTASAIIKPFTQTYRLFLRWWNQKEYVTMLEKERKSLEHELNVQAHNNLMLLYVALDLEFKQAGLNTDHMFKKDNFYNIATHAFEGGAIFAGDIELSKELSKMFVNLSELITKNFNTISSNPAAVQSIYAMNEIIWSSEQLREGYRIKRGLEKDIHYQASTIKDLCIKAAETNKQVLHSNKKTYPQYLKDWISEPKNVAKAGLVLGAIGGLYIFGPAVPAWLKEYTNKSVTSLVESVKSGTTTMINSVKNLWNKVRGNATELPDSADSRMEAQETEADTNTFFIKKGRTQAAIDEKARVFENYHQEYQDALDQEKHEAEEHAFKEQQRAGQALNDFDTEIRTDERDAELQMQYEIDSTNAEQAEARERKETRLSQLASLKEEQDREFAQEQQSGRKTDAEVTRFNAQQEEARERKETRLSQLSQLKEEQDREFVQEQRKEELQLQKEIQLKDKPERELQERNAAADRAKALQAEELEALSKLPR